MDINFSVNVRNEREKRMGSIKAFNFRPCQQVRNRTGTIRGSQALRKPRVDGVPSESCLSESNSIEDQRTTVVRIDMSHCEEVLS